MSKRVVIIHGTEGYPDEGWFPWLRAKVAAAGGEAVSPTFSTPQGQDLENWTRELDDQVGVLGSGDVLIGHSIGGSFALRTVASLSSPIAGTFIAAGVTKLIGHPQYDPLIKPFVDEPFPWAEIKRNAGIAHVYHGERDNLVPESQAQEIADGLGIQLQIIGGVGHFSGDDGFTEFPQLWADLALLLDPDA